MRRKNGTTSNHPLTTGPEQLTHWQLVPENSTPLVTSHRGSGGLPLVRTLRTLLQITCLGWVRLGLSETHGSSCQGARCRWKNWLGVKKCGADLWAEIDVIELSCDIIFGHCGLFQWLDDDAQGTWMLKNLKEKEWRERKRKRERKRESKKDNVLV